MIICYLFSLLLLNSCMVSKKVLYVHDMAPDSTHHMREIPALRLQHNDRISIVVSSKNPELVIPFNNGTGAYTVGEKGEVTATGNAAAGPTYLVDQQGNITFPILGDLKVAGLSLEEMRDLIQQQLISRKIVNDPIVKAEILNVKVSVMGAVRSEIVMNVPDGRMTILEAISKAGGLSPNAAADRITVIREENGQRIRMINDIQSQRIFDSPAYYLQQNDIVYVEPRAADNTPKEERSWRILGTVMGSLTFIISIISLVK
ncbi:sugar transporter [Sphingobacterium sp. CZ-UAM]|nr:sugar transporter [Sphingobacterium sp. CZ-UAM]